jgi:hypothetical protein
MECQCGCGAVVLTASFQPGHDQKLRADLERRVGGIFGVRELVEAAERFHRGESNPEALGKTIEAILKKSDSAS